MPPELLEHIAAYLSPRSVRALGATSRQHHATVNRQNTRFWRAYGRRRQLNTPDAVVYVYTGGSRSERARIAEQQVAMSGRVQVPLPL